MNKTNCGALNTLFAPLPPPPRHLSLLGPYIIPSTLFFNTFNPPSFPNVREQIAHPYKTADKYYIFLYFKFSML
jgi:hypothetical protein